MSGLVWKLVLLGNFVKAKTQSSLELSNPQRLHYIVWIVTTARNPSQTAQVQWVPNLPSLLDLFKTLDLEIKMLKPLQQ